MMMMIFAELQSGQRKSGRKRVNKKKRDEKEKPQKNRKKRYYVIQFSNVCSLNDRHCKKRRSFEAVSKEIV